MDKNKLTIGEFNDSFMPVMDGVVNVLNNYCVELNKMGHKAYAIVPGYKDSDEYDKEHNINYAIRGKEYYPISKIKPYGITTFPHETKKLIESIPFDIVHAHCPTFSGSLAMHIAKTRKIPIVSTFHTFFKDDLMELLPPFMAETIVKTRMSFYYNSDEVWAPTEACKKKIEREYYFTGDVRVVRNCADFIPPKDEIEFEERKRRGRELIGAPIDTPILLYVGQHKDEKNIPLTLEAIKALKTKIGGDKFKMVFVGEGHRKEHYEEYVKNNNLEDCVTFLGRISDREKLGDIYASAYLFLFPSLYDTAGIVEIEAACFSVPLVIVEGSCTNEGITDNENGFIVKNEVRDYCDRLVYILNHPEIRDYVGNNARKTVYRSWKDVCLEVEKLYYEIIEKKKLS